MGMGGSFRMEAKRPRLPSERYLKDNLNNQELIIQDFIRKSINGKMSEMHLLVKSSFASKDNSIDENKLAFSAVARENKTISEENSFLRKQLDESFYLIIKKDEDIEEKEKEIEVKRKEIIEEINGKMNESEEKYEEELKDLV